MSAVVLSLSLKDLQPGGKKIPNWLWGGFVKRLGRLEYIKQSTSPNSEKKPEIGDYWKTGCIKIKTS
jgi:hypothetical protein